VCGHWRTLPSHADTDRKSGRISPIKPGVEVGSAKQQPVSLMTYREAVLLPLGRQVVNPVELAGQMFGCLLSADPRLGESVLISELVGDLSRNRGRELAENSARAALNGVAAVGTAKKHRPP
jgi:hypothetical protein